MKSLILLFLSLMAFNENRWNCLAVKIRVSFNYYKNTEGIYENPLGKSRFRYHNTSKNIVALDAKNVYYNRSKHPIVANSFGFTNSSLYPVPNPLEITLNASFLSTKQKNSSITLRIIMWDEIYMENFATQLLDYYYCVIPIQPPYFQEHFILQNKKKPNETETSRMAVSLSVTCEENMYGERCDTFCRPESHYVCSTEGKQLCLSGPENAANNCPNPSSSSTPSSSSNTPSSSSNTPSSSSNTASSSSSCSSNPCMNGGTCVTASSDFTCTCPAGFGGVRCQSCSLNCSKGTCEIQNGKPTCRCPSYASGPNCGSMIDPCAANNPCQNGGKCHTKVSASGHVRYVCECPLGFAGFECNDRADACTANLCSTGSTCASSTTAPTGYTCLCPNTTTGTLCETDVNECDANPNLCDKDTEKCINSYGGYYCERNKFGHCKNADCGKGGICVELDYKYYCRCMIGWSGHNCNFSGREQLDKNLGIIGAEHGAFDTLDGSGNGPNIEVLAMGLAAVAAWLHWRWD